MIPFTEDADTERNASGSRSRYANLRSAGRELAVALRRYREMSNTIVLGIVSGGVPVAHEVASDLERPLDFIINRTLLVPAGPGSEVCAASVAGVLVWPEELRDRPPALPSAPLDYFLADAITALEKRQRICRGDRPPRNLNGQNAIVVDCGIRSGLTMRSAIEALRTRNPAQIIAAVPLGSADGCALIAGLVDELVCLAQPESFAHAGIFYHDFNRPADEQFQELLAG
jgi:putative phosphoribosyl transferase